MKDTEKWNEFDWESAFREDDANIRKYMDCLPKFIDIPGEDNIIFERVRTGGKTNPAFPASTDYDPGFETEDEDCFQEEWEKRKGSKIFKKAAEQARMWLLIQSSITNVESRIQAFTALSLFGMITGRLVSAINTYDDVPSFAIAHSKRIRRDLSSLEKIIRDIEMRQPEMKNILRKQMSALSEMSEMVTDYIFELKGREIKS